MQNRNYTSASVQSQLRLVQDRALRVCGLVKPQYFCPEKIQRHINRWPQCKKKSNSTKSLISFNALSSFDWKFQVCCSSVPVCTLIYNEGPTSFIEEIILMIPWPVTSHLPLPLYEWCPCLFSLCVNDVLVFCECCLSQSPWKFLFQLSMLSPRSSLFLC